MCIGGTAKQIFDRAQLPNDILVRIWNLADREQRGKLSVTEFIIAMHLLASYKTGTMHALPQTLPPGLFDAARRGASPRPVSGSRQTTDMPAISTVQRQFSGLGPQRTSSPLARPPSGSPATSAPPVGAQTQPGVAWAVVPQEKAQFDTFFTKLDTESKGYVTGDQAVGFFGNSRLPENDLAQIWDLADINSKGQLNRDEFAVAMHLIRQQLAKRGPLPQSLPPNLVPPSMRRQPVAASQSTAPAFDTAAYASKPKSAAEDLFGLDAFSSPATQIAQSTGASAEMPAVSTQGIGSPLQPQQTHQPTVFKPFKPSSSFGQTMMTPQATGGSSSTAPSEQNRAVLQQQRQHPSMDDLLGDTDPEISKRLTQETTELANLSNQVGTLTNQMQEVKTQRASTEHDLSQMNTQKRDFETRLFQLRAAYEQEVRNVKALEERLAASKNETKKLQQDISMVEHTYQNLQEQHHQVASALDADQKEKANLMERMRQINNEIGQLKPQVEKVRSEARQQKGLVAINKKQLSTIEAERDRINGELQEASKELDETNREVEESKRSIETASQELEESKHTLETASQAQTVPPIASPATSTTSQSMNPFFRRTTTASAERGIISLPFSPQGVSSPNHNAFDSFFGPSFEPKNEAFAPSPNFFEAQATEFPDTAKRVSEGYDRPTISTSSPSIQTELPSSNALPPPPPQSRQISSSVLPLRDSQARSSSPSSSVGVAAPASRFGDTSGLATPIGERQISSLSGQSETHKTTEASEPDLADSATPNASSTSPERKSSSSADLDSHRPTTIGTSEANNGFRELGQSSALPDIPGSFPGASTPFHTPLSSSGQLEESSRQAQAPFVDDSDVQNELTDAKSEMKSPLSANDDFDAAFAGFANNVKAPDESIRGFPAETAGSSSHPAVSSEFPPIQEFGTDDDSDSESDHGFNDNFAPATPQRQQSHATDDHAATTVVGREHLTQSAQERPEFDRAASNTSQLPTPNAQQSPPTYDQTVAPNGHAAEHRDSNQFPAEYRGLLPSREDPTSSLPPIQSPETAVRSPSNGDAGSILFGQMTSKERALSGSSLPASQMPMAPGSTAALFAYDNNQALSQVPTSLSQPPIPLKNAFDDFDNEFGDLSEAQAADGRGEDDFHTSTREGFDEFNPAFDSPAPSKTTTNSMFTDNSAFHNFESSIHGSSQAFPAKQGPAAGGNHDWDAIFAGLGGVPEQANGNSNNNMIQQPAIPLKESFPTEFPAAAGPSSSTPSKPPLGRALTSGTEHDDPILKRLTGMGYPRDESLSALERFDYNLDKVRVGDMAQEFWKWELMGVGGGLSDLERVSWQGRL